MLDARWALLAPVTVLGGIYGGVFTPTEASVVAAVYGLLVGLFVYRELNWSHIGARVVAKAWNDPAFRQALLEEGSKAVASLGYQVGDHLVVVANTPQRHNMVVCTLCSCYPWDVLGLPPVWYKSSAYRSRAVKEPRAVLADFDVSLPPTTQLRVWDSTAETLRDVADHLAQQVGVGALFRQLRKCHPDIGHRCSPWVEASQLQP